MTLTVPLLPDFALAFMLTFARVGAMMSLMPGFGEQVFPPRLRLTIALMLTLMLVPVVRPLIGPPPAEIGALVLLLTHEIVVGIFIGLTIRFVSATMITAGTLIAQQAGLGFVTQVDPTQGGQSVLVANFLALFGVLVVFTAELHHLAIAGIHDSYRLFRPGADLPVGDFVQAAVAVFAGSFAIAVKIAAPFLVAGLVFQVAMGVLGRLMPQLQIFFLALPVQITASFLMLAAIMSTIATWYATHVAEAIGRFVVR